MIDFAAAPRDAATVLGGSRPTRDGLWLGSSADILAAREAFARDHCIVLPGFIHPEFLNEIATGIEHAAFHRRQHGSVGSEGCMEVNATLARLLFAVNSPRVFATIDEIAGCGAIGCFDGRVYRLGTFPSDRDSWHDDVGDNRLVAMSVNVGAAYIGGELQLRDVRSHELLHEAKSADPGDALLFRIAPGLEHRVAPIKGTVPRTAFAGWFKSRPSFHAVLHGEGWSART